MSTRSRIYDESAYINAFKLSGGQEINGRNEVRQLTSISGATPNRGQEFVFNLNSWGDNWVNEVSLITKISAITKTGGTYVRACNAFGLFMLDRIDIHQNGKLLSQYYPHYLYQRLLQDWNADELPVEKKLLGIASDSDRNTLAGSSQTFVLRLGDFFPLFAMPLPIFLLNDPIQLTFVFRNNISELVQTDGTSPAFTYTDCHLSVRYVDPIGKSSINSMVRSQPFPIFDEEIVRMMRTVVGNSSQTTFEFNLQELSGKQVVQIPFFVNTQANKSAGNHITFGGLSQFTLTQASKYITDEQYPITDQIYRYEILPVLDADGLESLFADNLYTICYADHLKLHLQHHLCPERYSGSRDFTGQTDVKLSITYGSAPSANEDLYVFAECVRRLAIANGNIEVLY